MSNLTLNQTEAKSWFLVANGLKGLDYISMVYFLEVSLIFTFSANNNLKSNLSQTFTAKDIN